MNQNVINTGRNFFAILSNQPMKFVRTALAMSLVVSAAACVGSPDETQEILDSEENISEDSQALGGASYGALDSTSLAALQWQLMPGSATAIDIGANGSVFVISTNPVPGGYGISRFDPSVSGWVNYPGGAVRIAVDPSGNPLVVNNQGYIFRGNASGNYTVLPGSAKDIAVGANGTIFVIGTNPVPGGYGIWRFDPSIYEWVNYPGGAVRIAVDPNGNPWVVNNQGYIFRGNASGNFTVLPGRATDIAVGATGDAYITNTTAAGGGYQIQHWNGTTWDTVPGGAVEIAVGSAGNPWVTNKVNLIYKSTL